MKVIVAIVVTAVIDIVEEGGTATVNMLPPKMNHQAIIPMCTDPEEARDLTLIATAHVLEFLSRDASQKRDEIGEPASFGVPRGNA